MLCWRRNFNPPKRRLRKKDHNNCSAGVDNRRNARRRCRNFESSADGFSVATVLHQHVRQHVPSSGLRPPSPPAGEKGLDLNVKFLAPQGRGRTCEASPGEGETTICPLNQLSSPFIRPSATFSPQGRRDFFGDAVSNDRHLAPVGERW